MSNIYHLAFGKKLHFENSQSNLFIYLQTFRDLALEVPWREDNRTRGPLQRSFSNGQSSDNRKYIYKQNTTVNRSKK